jgi:hypothetical protein
MIERLRGQLRDTGPVPIFARAVEPGEAASEGKPDELQQFVEAAIMDYSQYQPRFVPWTLQIVAGQTSYVVPADFVEVHDGARARFPMEFEVYGSTLVLSAVPDTSTTVNWSYRAMHDAGTIRPFHEPAIIDYAMARALRAIVADSKKLDQFVSYELPGTFKKSTENASEAVNQIRATANDLEKTYLARVNPLQNGSKVAEQDKASTPFMTFG